MKNFKKIFYAVATLAGTTIGVGLFSLPYLASKIGFVAMVFYFLILGALVTIIHLNFGELSLATPDYKRLPGFAKIYFGDKGEKVAVITALLGTYGAILAYIIVGGKFLGSLLSPLLGIENAVFYTVLYFIAGALLIFFGFKSIVFIEALGLILFFVILSAIFFKTLPLINISEFLLPPVNTGLSTFFLPYGAVLFSLWGAALIPEVEEMLGKDKELLRKVIPIATFIPVIVYLFFVYLVLGITGSQTTEEALLGLNHYLGNGIVSLALVLGIITTFTSFITLGLTLKRVFWYDLKIGKNLSWFIACFPPLIIFLLGLNSFITVISLGGGIMLGVEGILILLMSQKLKDKKSWPFTLFLISIFIIGLLLELIHFLTK